jgi:hypothetical protein
LFSFFKGQVSVADAFDVVFAEFAVFLVEVFMQRLEPRAGIDELHLPFAIFGFAVGEYPDVDGYACVVKQI